MVPIDQQWNYTIHPASTASFTASFTRFWRTRERLCRNQSSKIFVEHVLLVAVSIPGIIAMRLVQRAQL